MRFVPLAIQMLVVLFPLAAADPFSPLVTRASLDELRSKGQVTASIPADSRLRLVPAISSRDAIAAGVTAAQPTVGTELLTIITGMGRPADSDEGWLTLYNALHSVSTMRGITYWSGSRKKEEVLFLQSYALDAESRRTRIPDPAFTSIPPEDDLYTFQEDGSFGRNTYREHFLFQGDHLVVRIVNISVISLFLVPIIQAGNLVTQVVLVPRGDEVLFYGVSYMNTAMPIGGRRAREESLMHRLLAVEGWLRTRLIPSAGH
jgi:hypothetical protein